MFKPFLFATLSFIVLTLLFSASACEVEQPLRLNAKDKKTIDTLFMAQSQTLRQELDSICNTQYDRLIRLEVDSILSIRLEEIARQRQRFEQRQQKNKQ